MDIYSFSAASSICQGRKDISLLSLPGADTAPVTVTKLGETTSNSTAFLMSKALIALLALARSHSNCPTGSKQNNKDNVEGKLFNSPVLSLLSLKDSMRTGKSTPRA